MGRARTLDPNQASPNQVLALTDLPIIVTRTYTFLVLRSTGAAASLGLGGLDQARLSNQMQ